MFYKINSNLYDIRLDLEKVGIKNFLSTWAYKDDNLCFIVDPGPSILVDTLKKALGTLKIGKHDLNYILVTHIHIDHAGGTGKLISYFPDAKIVCHPKGIKHLIDPERLWDASVKTLGDMARIYEKINPIPEERFISSDEIGLEKINVIETLGHAPHHQSYLFKNYLFVGEVGGTHKEIGDKFYLRPATPPVFDYNAWKESIQKLLEKDLTNSFICYPHYGMRPNADLMLRTAEHQLSIWVAVIENLLNLQDSSNFYGLVISEIEKNDNIYANNIFLEEETRKFEFLFIKNCIDGILDFLNKRD
jgi:glyoxylase-like metal-dependent hydrolase (beta-lactamase superfamily II)